MVSTLLSSWSLLHHQRRLLAPRETRAGPESSAVGCVLPGTRDVQAAPLRSREANGTFRAFGRRMSQQTVCHPRRNLGTGLALAVQLALVRDFGAEPLIRPSGISAALAGQAYIHKLRRPPLKPRTSRACRPITRQPCRRLSCEDRSLPIPNPKTYLTENAQGFPTT